MNTSSTPDTPKPKNTCESLSAEVVERYDVDGVHFDYLRYPEHALRFSDSYTYRKYGNGRDLAQGGGTISQRLSAIFTKESRH